MAEWDGTRKKGANNNNNKTIAEWDGMNFDFKRRKTQQLNYERQRPVKRLSEMRITELLDYNLDEIIQQNDKQKAAAPVGGDIKELALRTEYFMGLSIGWPFPEMNIPQKQMSLHIVKALNSKKHVVLEAPTGTGKSAALLCTTLAWQRKHQQETGKTVKIIYCSRTHSQVAQCVKSLRGTPYRPAMTVLGSRDRMCIHQKISHNTNQECRNRTKETEKLRKNTQHYDDDNPSTYDPGDDIEAVTKISGKEYKPTCPHYRQLGSSRTANLVHETFRPSASSTGTHDIEDLVQFGKNPYERTIVVQKRPHQSWGMTVTIPANATHPKVVSVSSASPLGSSAGSLNIGDWIFQVNDLDTAHKTLDDVCNEMRNSTELVKLRVGKSEGADGSLHSSCPYYISRALEKHAELVFCPYNYILDPGIRKALNIDLENNVVILDEAHNVENVLRDGGSGEWSEFQLCEMISALQYYAQAKESYAGTAALLNKENDPKEVSITEVAHELLLFLERIVLYLIDHKRSFEQNGGAQKAIQEWEKFKTPNSTTFEMQYYGPDGRGKAGKPKGCEGFFETLSVNTGHAEKLAKYAELMYENIQGRDNVEAQLQLRLFEELVDVVTKLATAMSNSEHFYVQSAARVNGSFEFAAGKSSKAVVSQRFNAKPKPLPYAPNRSSVSPSLEVPACKYCSHVSRGHELVYINGAVRHGSFNNGAMPPWEAVLILDLLTPSLNMKDLAQNCRSVILASGSLAPLPSLCAELGLSAAKEDAKPKAAVDGPLTAKSVAAKVGEILNQKTTARLQDKPPPLEAGHVVNLNKQLLAVAIGQFPNGEQLTVSYNNYKHDAFVEKLGGAIAAVIESIPRGGVLVFLPSYSLLRRCVKAWNPESSHDRYGSFNDEAANVWSRFEDSKGKVIVEPTGSHADFDAARHEYAETIKTTGNCILFAVFRGKMSEGISFNDDNARGVICIGIPFPSSFDRTIKAKKSYNDEQRKLGKRTDVLPGNSWYNQQAYRAIGQALGRCIRHAGDFGTVVLMDSRHCDESPPDHEGVCRAHRQLPKWMRAHVKTLAGRSGSGSNHDKIIGGGWRGLKETMEAFFDEAPTYTEDVLKKQQERFEAMRAKVKDEADETKPDRPISAGSTSSIGSARITGGGGDTMHTPLATFGQPSVTPSQPSASKK